MKKVAWQLFSLSSANILEEKMDAMLMSSLRLVRVGNLSDLYLSSANIYTELQNVLTRMTSKYSYTSYFEY